MLHARLAVIDPAGGAQPMTLEWADERYVLVYNGELYNTHELCSELAKLGHLFLGHSDTEVLLHAFAQWGEGCLEKLNGIYAFAIWQEKRRRLFLARDRMGVKPLFFMRHAGGLLFASEIKTILKYPTVSAELDEQGAAEILLMGPGRSPGCGVFRGMEELEPGCCGWYEDVHLSIRRYWRLLDRVAGPRCHPPSDGIGCAYRYVPFRRPGLQSHQCGLRRGNGGSAYLFCGLRRQ